jgi:hypothetical protein
VRHVAHRLPDHAVEVEREPVSDGAADDGERQQRGHDHQPEHCAEALDGYPVAFEQAGLCDTGHLHVVGRCRGACESTVSREALGSPYGPPPRGLDSSPRTESEMAQYTRVATFEFDDAALAALLERIRSEGMPDGVPAKRVTVLADRAGKVIVAVRFDSKEDLEKGSVTLSAMSPPDVGTRRRVSVESFEVVLEQEA